jgi:putative transposase
MAPRRLFVQGLTHHVYHRGNNGTDVFRDDSDRVIFLMLLDHTCRRTGVQVHAYALMTTHYHAMVTAPDAEALPRAMQRLGRRYVRYFNDRYKRTGTLWEGRYQASLIESERYWFTCMRYVESNPVEARIVPSPEAYAWSSYRFHALGEPDRIVTPHELYKRLGTSAEARQAEWRAMCGAALSAEQLAVVRTALRTNSAVQDYLTPETHLSSPPAVVFP